jgi:DNA helicase-2/ATP-dependent DNA helicase PcrA
VIYFADLHVHSRFSIATSKDCNLPELARWAALKGIKILATGDFTHPGWSAEIHEMLQEAEEGLYKLKAEYVPPSVDFPGGFGPADVRFVLNVEISSIYKKDGAVRKVHNLVFMPDFDSMDRFNARLDKIGNIRSDGRPILGLDARYLLEIALETAADSYVIPAHVWTPWFSILGSRSGFDSVEECFGDLASHIFALETGLSSDPEMNFRIRALDRFTLVSNSDIHSPSKLGREANILTGTPGYLRIRDAIRRGGSSVRGRSHGVVSAGSHEFPEILDDGSDAFVGTIEFFPEEGKYHLDGHRKCAARLWPQETVELNGKCPVCGSLVTVGVMNRVNELADRAPGIVPDGAALFWRLVPLVEIIAQARGTGPQSKKVGAEYLELLKRLGPELRILWSIPLDEIRPHVHPVLHEAIRRVRMGELSIEAGFDGQYGKVELFGPGERDHFEGQSSLVSPAAPVRRRVAAKTPQASKTKKGPKTSRNDSSAGNRTLLNEEQELAARTFDAPVLVQAGPGTGKTRTLTHRIGLLMRKVGDPPEKILAVTFTRKAAAEMQDRVRHLLGEGSESECWVGTFHQLGRRILDVAGEDRRTLIQEAESRERVRVAVLESSGSAGRSSSFAEQISLLKQNLVSPTDTIPDAELARVYAAYEDGLERDRVMDLDDLIARPVTLLRRDSQLAETIRSSWASHVLVDEFQDVNAAQYELLRLLSSSDGSNLFVIGDPDQAIYGFRGSDSKFFFQFMQDYPSVSHVRLKRNYRSQPHVLSASAQVLEGKTDATPLIGGIGTASPVKIVSLPNPALEGKFIVRTIEQLLGGASFFALDSGKVSGRSEPLGLGDFAVLYRLNALGDAIEQEFAASGLPYQRSKKRKPEEETDDLDPRAEAVTLLTMHAAKGLEFPVVFVAGCEDGVIPYDLLLEAQNRSCDLEEERRLLYVALTRSCRELFITHCKQRSLFGRNMQMSASRFLESLSPSLCSFMNPFSGRGSSAEVSPVQVELFS